MEENHRRLAVQNINLIKSVSWKDLLAEEFAKDQEKTT